MRLGSNVLKLLLIYKDGAWKQMASLNYCTVVHNLFFNYLLFQMPATEFCTIKIPSNVSHFWNQWAEITQWHSKSWPNKSMIMKQSFGLLCTLLYSRFSINVLLLSLLISLSIFSWRSRCSCNQCDYIIDFKQAVNLCNNLKKIQVPMCAYLHGKQPIKV